MSIIRYDPLREAMQQMRHQLFHQHFEQPYEETHGTGGGWSPLVDVFEDSEGITLKVELPEVDANDVDIQLEGNALTLRGGGAELWNPPARPDPPRPGRE